MSMSIFILKAIDSTYKIKIFLSQSCLQVYKGYFCSCFENKQRMNEEIEEIYCITYDGKTVKNEWENEEFLQIL